MGLPIFAGMLALTDVPDDNTAIIFIGALGFFLVYLIWVFTGIWRSAGRYRGKAAWAMFAKGAVAIGSLNVLVLIIAVIAG